MGDQKSKRFSSRWLARWFVILIVLAITIYCGGWYVLAGRLDRSIGNWIAAEKIAGRVFVCANRQVVGFPFRIGLLCDATGFDEEQRELVAEAGGFRSAAQIYRPSHTVAELQGPANFLLAGGSGSAQWALLRASLRLGFDGPEAISVEGRALNIAFDRKMATEIGGTTGFTADRANLHVRRNPQNGTGLDLALTVDNSLTNRIGGAPIMLAMIDASATLAQFQLAMLNELTLEQILRQQGASGIVHYAKAAAADQTAIALSGPFAIATDGRLSAKLKVEITRPENLFVVVAEQGGGLGLEQAQLAQAVELLRLQQTATGNGPLKLTVTITDGFASIGFIPLGPVPRLF